LLSRLFAALFAVAWVSGAFLSFSGLFWAFLGFSGRFLPFLDVACRFLAYQSRFAQPGRVRSALAGPESADKSSGLALAALWL